MTTRTPSSSFAVCTCATDAAARGTSSTERNTSSSGRFSSARIAASASAQGIGVESICSVERAVMNSGGSTSSREESTWPSLTKVTPASFKAETSASGSSSL